MATASQARIEKSFRYPSITDCRGIFPFQARQTRKICDVPELGFVYQRERLVIRRDRLTLVRPVGLGRS